MTEHPATEDALIEEEKRLTRVDKLKRYISSKFLPTVGKSTFKGPRESYPALMKQIALRKLPFLALRAYNSINSTSHVIPPSVKKSVVYRMPFHVHCVQARFQE